MFVVKTKLGGSKLHGRGVFADQDIKAGQVVWEFRAPFDCAFSQMELEALRDLPHAFAMVEHYMYQSARTGRFILCGDDARFTNHSDDPNTHAYYTEEVPEGFDLAKRDIKKGEEITCDYFEFDLRAAQKLGSE